MPYRPRMRNLSVAVRARGIAKMLLQEGKHGIHDARIDGCRGVIVEINRHHIRNLECGINEVLTDGSEHRPIES